MGDERSQARVASVASTLGILTLGKKNKHITLWLFNVAMENGTFIDDLPIKIVEEILHQSVDDWLYG